MILEELSADEMNAVEKIGKIRNFKAGNVIIEQGKGGASFFLILSGRADVRMKIPNGEERRLVRLDPCEVFGEICFLGVQSRSAGVVAVTDCTMLEFERDSFVRLMTLRPSIGMKVYKGMAQELARRLAKTDEELKDTIIWAIGELSQDPNLTREIDIMSRLKKTLSTAKRSKTRDPWADAS